MAPLTTSLLALSLPLAALISSASGHGHVTGIVVDGKWYSGWNAEMKYQSPLPLVAGWQADVLDNGFVAPSSFASPDIICHKSAANGNAYVPAKPGSQVTFQWNTWPSSHKGPVLDYLAKCEGECTSVDKTTLKFTKFAEGAWISGADPGVWVTDNLVANNNSWTTTLPSDLAPGNYVWRHEIIALHAASSNGGAQAYPQCVNFKVDGAGKTALAGGVLATALYKATDPGILFNLYSQFKAYTIPGPALVKFAKRHARDWMQ